MPFKSRLVSYLLTFSCLALGAHSGVLAAAVLSPQQLEQALTAAQQAYGQKKYKEALPHFARFYAHSPQAHGVAIQYAYALIQQRQYPTALSVLNGVALHSANPQEVQQAKKMIAQLVQSDPQAKQYQAQYIQKLHTGHANQTLQNIQSLLKQLDIELGQMMVRVDLISRQLDYANPDNVETHLKAFEGLSQELRRRINELRPHRETLNRYGAALVQSHQRLSDLKNAQTSRLFQKINCDCDIDPHLGHYVITPLIADTLVEYAEFEVGVAAVGQRIYQLFAQEGHPGAATWLNYRKQHCQRVQSGLNELNGELNIMRQYDLENLDENVRQYQLIAQRYKQACGS
ncbi:MAG: tetratricopeptide repeat protein [Candidatus Sericytochromatia bacterium]